MKANRKYSFEDLKARILKAKDHEERWEWICKGFKHEKNKLEEFAEERFPGFERPVFKFDPDLLPAGEHHGRHDQAETSEGSEADER